MRKASKNHDSITESPVQYCKTLVNTSKDQRMPCKLILFPRYPVRWLWKHLDRHGHNLQIFIRLPNSEPRPEKSCQRHNRSLHFLCVLVNDDHFRKWISVCFPKEQRCSRCLDVTPEHATTKHTRMLERTHATLRKVLKMETGEQKSM